MKRVLILLGVFLLIAGCSGHQSRHYESRYEGNENIPFANLAYCRFVSGGAHRPSFYICPKNSIYTAGKTNNCIWVSESSHRDGGYNQCSDNVMPSGGEIASARSGEGYQEERQMASQTSAQDRVEPENIASEVSGRVKTPGDQKSSASMPVPSKWGGGWERFGDWYVKALHDDMDLVTHVRLFTEFTLSEKSYYHVEPIERDLAFGFSVFGGSLVTTSHTLSLGGRDYWPHCDNDLSSASIDGGRAIQVATIPAGGSCNNVDAGGALISQFRRGQNAKIRVSHDDGAISLKGFSAAWDRARQLSHR